MKPNPECDNKNCQKNQLLYQDILKSRPILEQVIEEKKVVHTENDWGIEIISSFEEEQMSSSPTPQGTKREYDVSKQKISEEDKVKIDENVDVDELREMFKKMSQK